MMNPWTPEVHWAQRSCYVPEDNCIYLTVNMQDVSMENLSITYDDKKVVIDAQSSRTGRNYHLELNLYDDIYCDETKVNLTDRQLELELFKAEANSWWPQLLSDPVAPPFVKRDFDRWVDKDAQDGYPDSEEEAIANMDRAELKIMADAALAALPVSQGLEQPESDSPRDSMVAEGASQGSDSEEEGEDDKDYRSDDGGFNGDADSDDDSDNGDPPSGGSAPNGQGSLSSDHSQDRHSTSSSQFQQGGKSSGNGNPSANGHTSNNGSHHHGDNVQDNHGYQDDNTTLDDHPTDAGGQATMDIGPSADTKPSTNSDVSIKDSNGTVEEEPPHSSLFGGEDKGCSEDMISITAVVSDNGNKEQDHPEDEKSLDDLLKDEEASQNHDWADNLNGVHDLITTAGRKLPFHLRPISFETWKQRVDRSIEIRNFRHSLLMKLPSELRQEIFSLALIPNDGIYFCPKLLEFYEMEWFRLVHINGLHEKNHSRGCHIQSKLRMYKEHRNKCYFRGSNMKRCSAPDLLLVSRAVHEEAAMVLYRHNTFTFGDIHGFVALECFINTIGTFNVKQLRKLNVHVPIWFHGPTLDKLRSTWVFNSAKDFGLTASTPHKDRIRGSFDACIRRLAQVGKLKELNLIVAPAYLKHWTMEYHPATEGMPKNKQIVYAKRLSVEEYIFKHILPAIPKLNVTVLAMAVPEIESARQEYDPVLMEAYDGLYATVQMKCEHYGFNFRRVDPISISPYWNTWSSV